MRGTSTAGAGACGSGGGCRSGGRGTAEAERPLGPAGAPQVGPVSHLPPVSGQPGEERTLRQGARVRHPGAGRGRAAPHSFLAPILGRPKLLETIRCLCPPPRAHAGRPAGLPGAWSPLPGPESPGARLPAAPLSPHRLQSRGNPGIRAAHPALSHGPGSLHRPWGGGGREALAIVYPWRGGRRSNQTSASPRQMWSIQLP